MENANEADLFRERFVDIFNSELKGKKKSNYYIPLNDSIEKAVTEFKRVYNTEISKALLINFLVYKFYEDAQNLPDYSGGYAHCDLSKYNRKEDFQLSRLSTGREEGYEPEIDDEERDYQEFLRREYPEDFEDDVESIPDICVPEDEYLEMEGPL